MGEVPVKLPDVGEGIAEAELTGWSVKVGDVVKEDDVLAEVMTDKAAVEIPSPVTGRITWVGGEVGEKLAIGSVLVKIETEDAAGGAAPATAPDDDGTEEAPEAAPGREEAPPPRAPAGPAPAPRAEATAPPAHRQPRQEPRRPLAAPAVRQRALDEGADLRLVPGSGPAGRITHEDLDAFLRQGGAPRAGRRRSGEVTEEKIVGLRRTIAERMSEANRRVPHITIVEEVDVTDLETLRARLNAKHAESRAKLTLLPFLIRAIVAAAAEEPVINAHFDDEAGVLTRHGAVHCGIATQTDRGLVVPVVRHAEALDLWDAAAEIARLSEAARTGTAKRDELGGSTITITSLGALGAIATMPIINRPEVAIIGVNRIATRPHWDGHAFVPRQMMNLSCSFDHRIVDGWNAARAVQELKTRLEVPAMLFVEG